MSLLGEQEVAIDETLTLADDNLNSGGSRRKGMQYGAVCTLSVHHFSPEYSVFKICEGIEMVDRGASCLCISLQASSQRYPSLLGARASRRSSKKMIFRALISGLSIPMASIWFPSIRFVFVDRSASKECFAQ